MSDAPGQADWSPEAAARLDKLISLVGGLAAAAKIAGKSDEALSRWRKGESRWDCWAVARLCRASNKSLDWLVFGESTGPVNVLTVEAVERAADFVLHAARAFPDLQPEDIARSIVRRARDLDESDSALTGAKTVGEQYTPR